MRNRKKFMRIAWLIVSVLAAIVVVFGIIIYFKFYSANIIGVSNNETYLQIPTNSDFEKVVQILKTNNLLLDEKSFRWTAHQLKYDKKVKPGRYLLKPKMNNRDLILLLRSGKQVPVRLTINNIRTKDQLVKRISGQIEAGEQALTNLMNDADYTGKLGFTPENILSMFLPDTYEFYWNTSADKFIQRMKKEYDKFWNAQRIMLARKIKFTPEQISILASIVQMETNKEEEKPFIAGVYINRLQRNWKLEADPTLVYALGDFSINRVLNVHKTIDSPYNTYKYEGLPPGPICLPSLSTIDAVLNYKVHNYLYFCARDDFSGYHSFASTYSQHLSNARKFQKALDQRGIRS